MTVLKDFNIGNVVTNFLQRINQKLDKTISFTEEELSNGLNYNVIFEGNVN